MKTYFPGAYRAAVTRVMAAAFARHIQRRFVIYCSSFWVGQLVEIKAGVFVEPEACSGSAEVFEHLLDAFHEYVMRVVEIFLSL